jgi:hypothetical protein
VNDYGLFTTLCICLLVWHGFCIDSVSLSLVNLSAEWNMKWFEDLIFGIDLSKELIWTGSSSSISLLRKAVICFFA